MIDTTKLFRLKRRATHHNFLIHKPRYSLEKMKGADTGATYFFDSLKEIEEFLNELDAKAANKN